MLLVCQGIILSIAMEKDELPRSRGRPRSFDRQEALHSAMELFWAKGYENTSIAELSEALGIAPPSLYAAFGDKESLFHEALDLYGECEGTDIWAAFLDAPTAREALESFLVRSAYSFTRRGRPRGCMIVLSGLDGDEGTTNIRRDLMARRRHNLQVIRDRLAAAAAAGELAPEADIDALARFYLTVQEGMSIQARDGASQKELLSVANMAMAAWPSTGT